MPLYPETQLAMVRQRVALQRKKIEQRENFLEMMADDAAEAVKLHGPIIEADKQELTRLVATMAQMEKDIAASKAPPISEEQTLTLA